MYRFFFILLAWCSATTAYADMETCRDHYYRQKLDAYILCLPQAEAEVPEGMKILGDMYYWDWGDALEKNWDEAMLWYKRAATAGNAEAKYNLGVMYEKGEGIAKDLERAAKWFLSAAKDGHREAQLNIANMYNRGDGFGKNSKQAVRWYSRAAHQGEPTAQYNLGNLYARGDGIPANLSEAYRWYSLAEQNGGDADARANRLVLEKSMSAKEITEGKRLTIEWRLSKEHP